MTPTLERIAGSRRPRGRRGCPCRQQLPDAPRSCRGLRRERLDSLTGGVRAGQGKYQALNTALAGVDTPLVVTVDADTHLQREALAWLIAPRRRARRRATTSGRSRAPSSPRTLTNIVTRMQSGTTVGINGVKRCRPPTARPRGAGRVFGVLGGRPPGGGRVARRDRRGHRPHLDADGLARPQRSTSRSRSASPRSRRTRRASCASARAGRAGMSRASILTPPHNQPRFLAKFVAGIDYLVPLLDIGFVFFWVPG